MANLYSVIYGVTSTTVIEQGQGFLVGINVTVAGTVTGAAYDAIAASGAVGLGPLVTAIPNATGFVANIPHGGWLFQNGLVVTPGSGQTINIMTAGAGGTMATSGNTYIGRTWAG